MFVRPDNFKLIQKIRERILSVRFSAMLFLGSSFQSFLFLLENVMLTNQSKQRGSSSTSRKMVRPFSVGTVYLSRLVSLIGKNI